MRIAREALSQNRILGTPLKIVCLGLRLVRSQIIISETTEGAGARGQDWVLGPGAWARSKYWELQYDESRGSYITY